METLTLSPEALEQLGQLLRDTPVTRCAFLFVEVLDQQPRLLNPEGAQSTKE